MPTTTDIVIDITIRIILPFTEITLNMKNKLKGLDPDDRSYPAYAASCTCPN
jgi:hypothetical protein